MTDRISRTGAGVSDPVDLPDDMLDDADLGLIADYLTGELPPERLAEVNWRLEHDEAFRNLAAPLVAAWSVAPKWEPHPMPRAELQRAWDDFTRRAGFGHQRRKARRWWIWFISMPVVLVMLVMLAAIAASIVIAPPNDPSQNPPRELDEARAEFVPVTAVPDSGGWMSVGRARVKLEPGAELFRSNRPMGYASLVKLDGAARFVYLRAPRTSPRTDSTAFVVVTAAGIVVSLNADFRVHARTDTTDVEVLRRYEPPREPAWDQVRDHVGYMPFYVMLTARDGPEDMIALTADEIGRVQAGGKPVKLRELRDHLGDNITHIKRQLKATPE